ncbi:DUF1275 family protein [Streptomyces noboritoensis]|uniref:DUF1275 family protein n=1 Tax=Streptomyces noboritoensis TaxID=67337 RepID=A0ABV6TGU6_9ACTN
MQTPPTPCTAPTELHHSSNRGGLGSTAGFALAGADRLSALTSVVSLAAFLTGALADDRFGVRFTAHRADCSLRPWPYRRCFSRAALGTTAVGHDEVDGAVRYTLIVLLGLAMGLQNAVARRRGVQDLTTTVLTLPLTRLAADSSPADGSCPYGRCSSAPSSEPSS